MAEKLLTDKQISAARARKSEYLLADGSGLYLRVRPGRSKQWAFIYQFDEKRRMRGLGAYPGIGIATARELATRCREQIAKGIDPAQAARDAVKARKAERQRKAARLTVRQLFDEWHKRRLTRRKDGGKSVSQSFERDIFKRIGDRYADEITKKDIIRILERVEDRGVTRSVKVLLGDLRQMFTYAVEADHIAADPTYALKKMNYGGKATRRSRTLSPDEIRELAARLPSSGLHEAYQAALWIMLATSCRVGELMRARWRDLDTDAGEWRIPAEHSKNGKAHLVHLSEFAAGYFETVRDIATRDRKDGEEKKPRSEWIFPGRDPRQHLDPKALNKQLQDRQREAQIAGRSRNTGALRLPGGEWTPHDLRRTGATLMGDTGTRSDVIKRCLNQSLGDAIVETYQRQELLEERRRAFDRLGQHLKFILAAEPGKIAAFRQGRDAIQNN